MKIALCLHVVDSMGGIINHSETLAHGFKELGHTVDLMKFCHQYTCKPQKCDVEKTLQDRAWEMSEFGVPVHPERNWRDVTGNIRVPYAGEEQLQAAINRLKTYDLIIWEIPVPTMRNENLGNLDWMKLYDVPVKQIAIIHDGNLKTAYPWISAIRHRLCGLACVHPCAYYLASELDVPRSLIVNPQDLTRMNFKDDWASRQKGFISIQTFKSWKRVQDLIRAIPYMDDYQKLVGGGGIECRYMMSQEKAKTKYRLNKKYDPDLPDELDKCGKLIFEYALEHGMTWLGYINSHIRDEYLDNIQFLIDPSWSTGYAKIGDHFNRTIVEASMKGVIPIIRQQETDPRGEGLIFKPGVNYLTIPRTADTPKKFAESINDHLKLDPAVANEMRTKNFELCKLFECKKIAQDFIDLSEGKPCGIFNTIQTGMLTEEIQEASDEAINGFFSGISNKTSKD